MQRVTIKNAEGYSAEVCLHGGHVVSWKTPAGEDVLFVSGKAIFEAPKAIRGGVPVCFPQFGMMGPMSTQHGFARNVAWTVESKSDHSVTMLLAYDGKGRDDWSSPFELRTVVALGPGPMFTQELAVKNTGGAPLPFTCALHTYYSVRDIAGVKVQGLAGVKYLDNLQAQKEEVEGAEAITFTGELDRVYVGAPDVLTIVDEAGGRSIELTKSGFPDAVVWNPWVDKAAKMADFGDSEYTGMLCIEPAVAGSGAVTLEAGASWKGVQAVKLA